MKKFPILFAFTGLFGIALPQSALAQSAFPPGTSLPPRGYILPPTNGPVSRPAPSAPPAARYPRPESNNASLKKSTSTASTSTKKKPALTVASKSTKKSTTAKTAKVTPKKPAPIVAKTTKKPSDKTVVASSNRKKETGSGSTAKVASVKQPSVDAKSAKPDLGEIARDLHAKANNKPAVVMVDTAASTALLLKTFNSVPMPTFFTASAPAPSTVASVDRPKENALDESASMPPAVITHAEQLPSHLAGSSAMMPLPMKPSAPPVLEHPPIAETITAAPKATVVGNLPIEEFPAEEDETPPTPKATKIAESTGSSFPKVKVREPIVESPKVAERTPVTSEERSEVSPLLTTVKPSLASVQPAAYRTPAPQPSSDFFPGGSSFQEPMNPPKPTTPAISLSPSLGTMTIDAERADSESNKNLVTFNGNVDITCKRFQMKADKVVATMRPPENGGGAEKVVSDGNVTVQMLGVDGPGYLASGSHAVYDPTNETIRLTGWPKIEEGNKALVASSATTEIVIDTKTSRLTTSGSTKTVIRQ